MKNNKIDYSLKYPIGEYDYGRVVTHEDIKQWINEIEILPAKLRNIIETLTGEQLNTAYRPGGWKVSQVVHHLCDSHLNGYIRFKLALTEDRPTIKPYDEAKWAALQEYDELNVQDSLRFLENIHKRWVILFKSMRSEEFEREFNHPEIGNLTIKLYIGAYAWHGNHHLAHITSLIDREGW
jgi:hypothetical protein